jgi:hypothetical protein
MHFQSKSKAVVLLLGISILVEGVAYAGMHIESLDERTWRGKVAATAATMGLGAGAGYASYALAAGAVVGLGATVGGVVAGAGAPLVVVPVVYGVYKARQYYRKNLMGLSSEQQYSISEQLHRELSAMSDADFEAKYKKSRNRRAFDKAFNLTLKVRVQDALKSRLDRICYSRTVGESADMKRSTFFNRKNKIFSSVTGENYLAAYDEHDEKQHYPYIKGFPHITVPQLVCIHWEDPAFVAPKAPAVVIDPVVSQKNSDVNSELAQNHSDISDESRIKVNQVSLGELLVQEGRKNYAAGESAQSASSVRAAVDPLPSTATPPPLPPRPAVVLNPAIVTAQAPFLTAPAAVQAPSDRPRGLRPPLPRGAVPAPANAGRPPLPPRALPPPPVRPAQSNVGPNLSGRNVVGVMTAKGRRSMAPVAPVTIQGVPASFQNLGQSLGQALGPVRVSYSAGSGARIVAPSVAQNRMKPQQAPAVGNNYDDLQCSHDTILKLSDLPK